MNDLDEATRTNGETTMNSIYPHPTREISHRRRDLAPNQQAAFDALAKRSLPTERCRQR